jgi:hypothetical protein
MDLSNFQNLREAELARSPMILPAFCSARELAAAVGKTHQVTGPARLPRVNQTVLRARQRPGLRTSQDLPPSDHSILQLLRFCEPAIAAPPGYIRHAELCGRIEQPPAFPVNQAQGALPAKSNHSTPDGLERCPAQR